MLKWLALGDVVMAAIVFGLGFLGAAAAGEHAMGAIYLAAFAGIPLLVGAVLFITGWRPTAALAVVLHGLMAVGYGLTLVLSVLLLLTILGAGAAFILGPSSLVLGAHAAITAFVGLVAVRAPDPQAVDEGAHARAGAP